MFSARATALNALAMVALATGWAWGGSGGSGMAGEGLDGFVFPQQAIQHDVKISALRASGWSVGGTTRLWLEGDVQISLGSYAFSASQAAIWTNRLNDRDGTVNQIAVFFDQVEHRSGNGTLSAGGRDLLVTASTRGQVQLNVALLNEVEPDENEIVRRGERRLARFMHDSGARPPGELSRNQGSSHLEVRSGDNSPDGDQDEHALDQATSLPEPLPETANGVPWIGDPQGTVRYSADRLKLSRGEEENTIIAIGSIVVESISQRESDEVSHLSLTAERAVIFTDPIWFDEAARQVDASAVRGIYLEGGVTATAERGTYAIRAPHVYYDFRQQKAIMLNALLRIQPREIRLPVIARAQEMRQLAENQWQARELIVSTSEFYTPHLAIGADRMTITEIPGDGVSDGRTRFDSQDNTLRVGGVPIFYWPRFVGDVEDVPLKSIEVGSRSNVGVQVLTAWNLFALAGKEAPDGVEADLRVDGYTEHGAAVGLDLRYDTPENIGRIDLYGMYDEGIDHTSSGLDVQPDDTFRGVALLEHQSKLGPEWLFQAQGSYLSDGTFISSWREDDFNERREYETSLYLKHQRDNSALTLLGKYALNDFISNSYLLASRQYSVDKSPELTYRRYGDSLFGELFTYSMENRLTRMRMVFQDTTPAQIGVPGSAFGIPANDSISAALFASGLRENWVNRIDSRHELALPIHAGPINFVPFVVGRFTGYDDDFESFSSDADELRWFGAAGVRANTQWQRVDNAAESRLFDIHRMRHLIEPYVTFWAADSNVPQDALPIFDQQVEPLAQGEALQVGLRNTWQTQRGGPGRWRSVDVLTLDGSVVFDSEDDETSIPQFFEYWPEYSQIGDHVRAAGIWLLSDHVTVAGEATYVLEEDHLARGSIGAELRHSPLLSTYVEYRFIRPGKSELLAVGWNYQLTPKYRIAIVPQYDFRAEDFRSLDARLTRGFPDFNFTLRVKYDRIGDETTIGAMLELAEF
ncbi:MAG: LPS assembly protein LptD [Phycisphaerales bacterium]|nr:LPS assembly protein LptD [Phycisphaerales bacterium]